MNVKIDAALQRLSEVPPHPDLDGLHARVVALVHARAVDGAVGLRLMAIAGLGAVLLGAVSSRPLGDEQPSPSLSPLGPSTPLAPSTLLAGDR